MFITILHILSPITNLVPSGGGSLSDAWSSLTAFFATITNGKMWRSLGWILLGLLMTILGAALLIRPKVSVI